MLCMHRSQQVSWTLRLAQDFKPSYTLYFTCQDRFVLVHRAFGKDPHLLTHSRQCRT